MSRKPNFVLKADQTYKLKIFFLFQKNKDQNEWLDSYNRALLEIKEEIKSELVTMINQERRL